MSSPDTGKSFGVYRDCISEQIASVLSLVFYTRVSG